MNGLLRGTYEYDLNALGREFDRRLEQVFAIMDKNESGEITLDELGRFMRELFKELIKICKKEKS